MQDTPTVREQLDRLGIDFITKVNARREIKSLPKILAADERIERLIQGRYGTSIGILVATDQRIAFINSGLVRVDVVEFDYSTVSSIRHETGMLFGSLTIVTSGDAAQIGKVLRWRVRPFAEYVRQRITPRHSTTTGPSADPMEPRDTVGQLERLVALHNSGALNDTEFAAQKSAVLRDAA